MDRRAEPCRQDSLPGTAPLMSLHSDVQHSPAVGTWRSDDGRPKGIELLDPAARHRLARRRTVDHDTALRGARRLVGGAGLSLARETRQPRNPDGPAHATLGRKPTLPYGRAGESAA